jgi:hypothetical protein
LPLCSILDALVPPCLSAVVRIAVKTRIALAFFLAVAGCARTQTRELVQGAITITPPLQRLDMGVLEDGGSEVGTFRDVKGRTFHVFIDYRLGTKAPGAVYLNGRPDDPKSILFTNGAALKHMLGL